LQKTWRNHATISFSKTIKIARVWRTSAIWRFWKPEELVFFLLHAHIWACNFHIALNFVSRCTGGGKSRDRFVKYDKYRAFPTIVRQAFSCDVSQYALFRSRLLPKKRKENTDFSLEIYVIWRFRKIYRGRWSFAVYNLPYTVLLFVVILEPLCSLCSHWVFIPGLYTVKGHAIKILISYMLKLNCVRTDYIVCKTTVHFCK
jgi:hypothetical protein